MATNQKSGIDERQRIARLACGISIPRPAGSKPKRVIGVVPVRCEKCECTGAKPSNAKEYTCGFCGAVVKGVLL